MKEENEKIKPELLHPDPHQVHLQALCRQSGPAINTDYQWILKQECILIKPKSVVSDQSYLVLDTMLSKVLSTITMSAIHSPKFTNKRLSNKQVEQQEVEQQ